MERLYPLKFRPHLFEKIWGGRRLEEAYGKKAGGKAVGESWEISSLSGDLSVVSNGFLEGNNLQEIIEVYMGDLVGESVFKKFGHEFPLLLKLINTTGLLSIQVHPDNETAMKLHSAWGKTELWYVMEAGIDSVIYRGFKHESSREEVKEATRNGTLEKLLNKIRPVKGDYFSIPAGTIHCIGGNTVIAEIQQASDVTYRLYDWGRKGEDGKPRELHQEFGLNVLDYSASPGKVEPENAEEHSVMQIGKNSYFTVNKLTASDPLARDYSLLDSFVILMCVDGECNIAEYEITYRLHKGETMLIPAITENTLISPIEETTILEIYIDQEKESTNE